MKLKTCAKQKNEYRFINASANFDFLPKTNRKLQSAKFYKLPFRIVRFKILDKTYETVIINLDSAYFPASEFVTSQVIVHRLNTKYVYKANFAVAIHLCRQLFLGNISPPDLEALVRKNISPICPGRSRPRNLSSKSAVSFIYRVA